VPVTAFGYDGHNPTSVTDPLGHVRLPRVRRQRSRTGAATSLGLPTVSSPMVSSGTTTTTRELVRKTEIATGRMTTLAYDHFDRLTRVEGRSDGTPEWRGVCRRRSGA
jgi:hypothetical protein